MRRGADPRSSQELGRLIAEVGVAPASPLEYLVLRITRDSSGRVEVAPSGGGGAPWLAPEARADFRFRVDLTRASSTEPQGDWPWSLGTGGFSECSGLTLEADVKEYLEGGFNCGVVRRVGRVKLEPIVLKRGMFLKDDESTDSTLWDWLSATVYGLLPIPRYDGQITVLDPSGKNDTATWCFDRGLPIKVVRPTLNAKTGQVAIEELHIAHEGLRLGPA